MGIFSAPIIEAMAAYSADGAAAFHTPGHKQGLGAAESLKKLLTPEGLRQEVSLMEELDDLHSPHSCIHEAETLAARLWHANDALFIVNGTSCAIQAMILATLRPGDLVFVPRNAHRSVMAGLILAGAVPVFLPVEFSPTLKIPLNLTPETVKAAIKKFPSARALIVTSPNYYGVAADLSAISALAHAAGMLLLVDEAHGAHLQFSNQLPPSAMDSGADLSAQSTHKLLGALSQASILLVKNSPEKVRRAASLLQTTSPNYLLLASLDAARLQMAQSGSEKLSATLELARQLRVDINSIAGLSTFDAVPNFALDLTKLTVNVERLGLTGLAAEKILRHEFKVQCELSDASNLLFLLTYADSPATASKLLAALKKLAARPKFSPTPTGISPAPAEISTVAVSPREIFFAPGTAVPLDTSIGKICAEEVTFYPPGIPILNAGEIITAEIVNIIRETKKIGGRITGAADTTLNTLKILNSPKNNNFAYQHSI